MYIYGEFLEPHELTQIKTHIEMWRSRLFDISWFMWILNEATARQINKEDDVIARHFLKNFCFESQALLDEQAVLSAMAYVDLYPIRAAMVITPEYFIPTGQEEG